jgi:hypothetical protein
LIDFSKQDVCPHEQSNKALQRKMVSIEYRELVKYKAALANEKKEWLHSRARDLSSLTYAPGCLTGA